MRRGLIRADGAGLTEREQRARMAAAGVTADDNGPLYVAKGKHEKAEIEAFIRHLRPGDTAVLANARVLGGKSDEWLARSRLLAAGGFPIEDLETGLTHDPRDTLAAVEFARRAWAGHRAEVARRASRMAPHEKALTREQAREIKRELKVEPRPRSIADLARAYGVSPATIHRVRRGEY